MEVFPTIRLSEGLPHEFQIRVKCQAKAHRVEDESRDQGLRGFPSTGDGLLVSFWPSRVLEGVGWGDVRHDEGSGMKGMNE